MSAGKQTLVSASASAASPKADDVGVPGKATLTQSHRINNAWIEGRERCAPGQEQTGCGLDPQTRERLVGAYQRMVRANENQYLQALGEIGLERMIQKDDELPGAITFVIDVMAGYLGKMFVKSLGKITDGSNKFLKSEAAMQVWQETGDDQQSIVSTLLASVNPGALELVTKTAGSEAIKRVKTFAAAPASDDKGTQLNYIDELKTAGARVWQYLDLVAPTNMTDGERIAAYASMLADNGNTIPEYKALLKAKIDRYMATAGKIGRAVHKRPTPVPGIPDKSVDVATSMRDTRVTWVTVVGDPVPHLYYEKADFVPAPVPGAQLREPRWTLTERVDADLMGTAITRHQQQWEQPVSQRMMSREELARETNNPALLMEPTALPRLDLGKKKAPTMPKTEPIVIPDALTLKGDL